MDQSPRLIDHNSTHTAARDNARDKDRYGGAVDWNRVREQSVNDSDDKKRNRRNKQLRECFNGGWSALTQRR